MSTVQAERASDSYALEPTPQECERLRATADSIEWIRQSVIGDDVLLQGAVRSAASRLCGLHGVRSGAVVYRGRHPPTRPAPVCEHAYRGLSHGVPHDCAAGGCSPDHPPGGRRRRKRRRHLLRVGVDRSDRHADPCARTSPARATGGVHRPVRAPLQRVALARGCQRRRHDPRGCRRAVGHRPPRARAAPLREPAAEDRQLLGRLERDGHHHRCRPCRGRSAPPRCALLLGLRDGRTVPADRDGGQGRRVPLSAQVHRWPRDSGCVGRQARAAAQSRAIGAGRWHRPVRQPGRPHLRPRPGHSRGGRHAGDHRVDSRRTRVRAEGGDRRRRDPPPRAEVRGAGAGVLERQPEDRDPREHHRPTAPGDLAWDCAIPPDCCIRTSS